MRKRHKGCMCGRPKCVCGYPQPKPAQQLPSQTMPAQQQPVNQNTEYVGQEVYIPVVHPTHTTQVNHTTYKYMHSYPHTKSIVNSMAEEHHCVCPPCQKKHHQHCKCHKCQGKGHGMWHNKKCHGRCHGNHGRWHW